MATGTKYLRKSEIEIAAVRLIADYGRAFGVVVVPPVPVDAILEAHLGLRLDVEKLAENLGAGVIGACWMSERRVAVDESLDPTASPSMEGRYRFTLAHEIGHWELHRGMYLSDPRQGILLGEPDKPSVVCRANAGKDPKEWQADQFAANLLMPKEMVQAVWRERCGEKPYVDRHDAETQSAQFGSSDAIFVFDAISRALAEPFRVSGQAMKIRLIELGLIRTEAPVPDLFTE